MVKDVAAFPAGTAEDHRNVPANDVARLTVCQTVDKPSSVLSTKLGEAELMLAHAAETEKDLKPELAVIIANARDAYARGAWTNDLTKQFWAAYSKLSAAIKPVTGESLVACACENLDRLVNKLQRFAIGFVCHQRRASGGRLVLVGIQIETFQRAHDCPDGVGGDACVERRRLQLRMSEQDLNHPDIGILLQKMGRKAMPERVW
jgi:hypothetical protein